MEALEDDYQRELKELTTTYNIRKDLIKKALNQKTPTNEPGWIVEIRDFRFHKWEQTR